MLLKFTLGKSRALKSTLIGMGLLGVAQTVLATNYYPTDTTIDYGIDDWNYIGRDSSGNNTSPTVTITTGGHLYSSVFNFNNSTLKMDDGTINGKVNTYNTSHTLLTGGLMDYGIEANDASSIIVKGGTVGNYLSLHGTSSAVFESGFVANAYSFGNSTFNMSGGQVFGNMYVTDNGFASITGGYAYNFQAYGGNVFLNGGSTTWLKAETLGTATLNHGGYAEYIGGWGAGSTVNIYGGDWRNFIRISAGTINIYGTGIGSTILNSDYNLYGWHCAQYRLSGILSDGTDINGRLLYIGDGGKLNLKNSTAVPGPAAILPFLLGLAMLKRQRSRR